MRSLWLGRYKSVTPRDFKNMVDQYIPVMQGHAQQDAQEFLAFLMNGLHEDLNRVQTRAQIADLDSNKLDERTLAHLTWENHLKRNKSVIVEFFQVS
jgi:ubiquitin C-terminal hydrolase